MRTPSFSKFVDVFNLEIKGINTQVLVKKKRVYAYLRKSSYQQAGSRSGESVVFGPDLLSLSEHQLLIFL